MRRADRLFHLIQILRRSGQPVTARALAAEIEVSPRTIYRDVADLIGQRVPIRGEAGLGYVLDPGFDLPPLMFTPDELDALVLGAQWVAGRGDPALARAARDVLAKVAAMLPVILRPHVTEPSVGAKPPRSMPSPTNLTAPPCAEPSAAAGPIDTAALRRAVREGRKVRLRYRALSGVESERVVWPVILGFGDGVALVIAWCELREDFRHFRIDRMLAVEVLETLTGVRPAALQRRWERWREGRGAGGGLAGAAGRRWGTGVISSPGGPAGDAGWSGGCPGGGPLR